MPHRRPIRILVLSAVLALAAASPAAALSGGGLTRVLARAMRPAGGASGALVVDLDTGRRLYAKRSGVRRMPASVEKLYTTETALLRLGPNATLNTSALAVQPLGVDGTLDGDLYLRGGGDPTLTSADLEQLAAALVQAGLTRITGHVVGDDSAFDALRGVPSAGYAISVDVEPLGALMVDRGRTGRLRPYYQRNPAGWAAGRLAQDLREDGVSVSRYGRAGVTPAYALQLATLPSPPVSTLIAMANVPSDNYIAETLLKAVGAADGGQGTTASGAAGVLDTIGGTFRLHPAVVDGSGLSRADRTSPLQVVRLLQRIAGRPEAALFRSSLAVAGRTGTLQDRLRRRPARGRCQGKTGTLRDVSDLAGYCLTRSGDTVAFAILMNYVNPYAAHGLQDKMVQAIAGYDG